LRNSVNGLSPEIGKIQSMAFVI